LANHPPKLGSKHRHRAMAARVAHTEKLKLEQSTIQGV
jgi:hypothetical protein